MGVYTAHLDFIADSAEAALDLAASYAEGLSILCPEVETRSARLSPSADWSTTMPVFCGMPSGVPDEVCTDRAGHPGGHSWGSMPRIPGPR
jgi:hypothetical protein